ncbi:MAG: hypothetical protein K8S13_23095 [Desulfobacula sp.]|uniref:hypothetical protein n=1 Tax=Desulfobacula sp. TaxID=2593537 RepID=UPI0025B9264A|nr:hypothetical protein [Desulfobacula sp.]MCD4722716.1 hypothetical protein [Desulfobacula sp.]
MTSLKTIGNSGQITLGKEYAGKQVAVDLIEPGVWVIKTGQFIPDNEKWLHTAIVEKKLKTAVSWAENNIPRGIDLTKLEQIIENNEPHSS